MKDDFSEEINTTNELWISLRWKHLKTNQYLIGQYWVKWNI